MPQVVISNGDNGKVVRDALNAMFGELYGAIISPIKVNNLSANGTKIIPANSYIASISVAPQANTPTLRIGTTPNGQEIMPDELVNGFIPVVVNLFCQFDTTLYFTLSGIAGAVNIRIDVLNSYF